MKYEDEVRTLNHVNKRCAKIKEDQITYYINFLKLFKARFIDFDTNSLLL